MTHSSQQNVDFTLQMEVGSIGGGLEAIGAIIMSKSPQHFNLANITDNIMFDL